MTSKEEVRQLKVGAINDPIIDRTIAFAVRHLRAAVDRTANLVARANADWHDDPEASDYAEFHSPAEVQFSREARDKAILDLVQRYLVEISLAERGAKCKPVTK